MASFDNKTIVGAATSMSSFTYGPVAAGNQFTVASFNVHRDFGATGNAIVEPHVVNAVPAESRIVRALLEPGWTWEHDGRRAIVLEAGMSLVVDTDADVEVLLTGVLRTP